MESRKSKLETIDDMNIRRSVENEKTIKEDIQKIQFACMKRGRGLPRNSWRYGITNAITESNM